MRQQEARTIPIFFGCRNKSRGDNVERGGILPQDGAKVKRLARFFRARRESGAMG
ncbi:hypothetical protein P1P91_06985 [Halomonas piscis]|uniref:Uncharacterized protein n=1 Tax=Halomonas piscis TaxID=3031727 RepID=A0ABY9Z4R3_9GAMM|nr:hypothetical protein [Halomonas piscis]WNK21409.1 hypothetical protein P1P91_06985 [Halomonas piscis]